MLLLFSGISTSQSITSVVVSPPSTNTPGTYTITGTLDNNAAANLDANLDSIIIVFNDSTTVPATIDPSRVTVNNTASNAVEVSGVGNRRIAILTPVNIRKDGGTPGQFTIVFHLAVPITNPQWAGQYRLRQFTSKNPLPVVISPAFTITASSSTVSSAGVTPNPSVANIPAAYTVNFNVGSGGGLTTASTITIAFPLQTTIPDGALSGVTVNGTPATASSLRDTVIIYCPVAVAANSSVTVRFGIGSGIVNPPAGLYTLAVRTSAENSFVNSALYTITTADQMSITAVGANPSTVNATAAYSLEFYTSSTGALSALNDSIIFIFPSNTYVPNEITQSLITISSGGFSDAVAGVAIRNQNRADDDTLYLKVPINIGNSSSVGITISSGAGILNPSVLGNYYITLRTTKDITPVTSGAYGITNATTSVSSAIVTPTLTAVSVRSPYRVEFNLGARGRLKPNASTITLNFDAAYTLSGIRSHYDSTFISFGGGVYHWVDTNNIAINTTLKTIQITSPANVYSNNGDNVVILLKRKVGLQPILNPAMANNYTIGVSTSVEILPVNSQSYYIGGTAITLNSVTLTSYGVNNISGYTFNITTTQQLKGPTDDWVQIVFPDNTTLDTTALKVAGNVTINGTNATVSVSLTTRTVTARVGANVNPGTFNVVILAAANTRNPPVPSNTFYKVTMKTSQDLQPVISSPYAIVGNNTAATPVSATASPSVINAFSSVYTVNMRATTNGRLVGGTPAGSSAIDITFGPRTRVPSFITPSSVKIGGQACETVNVLRSGVDSGRVRIFMPNGFVIENNVPFSVVFDSSARLDNLNPQGTSQVRVRTTSDTVTAIGSYTLTLTQAMYITSVVPTPSTVNAKAGYSIKFTTGSSGALLQGDTIYILFPSNTYLPPTFSKNDVTINGLNPLANPLVVGDTLKVTVPQPGGITNLTAVTVLINSTAGVLNPTLVATTYTMRIRTKAEPALVTSPAYSTTTATTTVSTPYFYLTDQRLNVWTPYTVIFKVGANGRLLAGTSTITISVGSQQSISTTSAADYDSVFITANGVSVKVPNNSSFITFTSSKVFTLRVPTGLTIRNGDEVRIDINRIGTPDLLHTGVTPGSYNGAVRTSVENTYVTSHPYEVSDQPPVSNILVSLFPDTVNAVSSDTVRFKVTALNAGGTVTITFPNNTFIPVSIPVTAVRLALGNSSTFSNASAVSTNPSQRTITVTTPIAVPSGGDTTLKIAFTTSAGIQNPSVNGSYTLQVRTSTQIINRTSAPYTLKPTTTTVTDASLSVTPPYPNLIGRYAWSFNTGSRGRLLPGTSTIIMIFPYDALFTQGVPSTSKVTINSVPAAALQLKEGTLTNPDTLIATVPSTVTIGNFTSVTVIIDSTAGIQNVSTLASRTYQIYTSVEPYAIGYDVSLPVVLSYFRAEQESGSVILNWRTESEIENAFWLIQKADVDDPENEYQSLSYSTIATLKGQGTTTTATDYIWSDSEIKSDRTYAYRIVDVAYNGAMTYHEPQKITVTGPKQFALYQNYPNPFNPVTTIKYQLPYDSKVTITIYNVLGQKVMELIDREQAQGFYSLTWNGRNDRLSAVASGLYIYRIKAKSLNGRKEWSATKKMLLLK